MQCFHDPAGPPLHTILFDIEADENKHGVYAQHTLDGFEHVLTEFEGLNLHDTVAIVVPDGKFRAAFATQLQAALDATYPNRFELVTSRKASAAIAATGAVGGGGGGGNGLGVAGGDDSKEWLVLDTMDAMAGLERALPHFHPNSDRFGHTGSAQTFGDVETKAVVFQNLAREAVALAR